MCDLLNKPILWEDCYVIVPSEPKFGYELHGELADANPFTSDDVFPTMAEVPL